MKAEKTRKALQIMIMATDMPIPDFEAKKVNEELLEIERLSEKQATKLVAKTDYDKRSDSYGLLCPDCNANVGSMDNEDGDGVYKHNLYFNYCPECGQKLTVLGIE